MEPPKEKPLTKGKMSFAEIVVKVPHKIHTVENLQTQSRGMTQVGCVTGIVGGLEIPYAMAESNVENDGNGKRGEHECDCCFRRS